MPNLKKAILRKRYGKKINTCRRRDDQIKAELASMKINLHKYYDRRG